MSFCSNVPPPSNSIAIASLPLCFIKHTFVQQRIHIQLVEYATKHCIAVYSLSFSISPIILPLLLAHFLERFLLNALDYILVTAVPRHGNVNDDINVRDTNLGYSAVCANVNYLSGANWYAIDAVEWMRYRLAIWNFWMLSIWMLKQNVRNVWCAVFTVWCVFVW